MGPSPFHFKVPRKLRRSTRLCFCSTLLLVVIPQESASAFAFASALPLLQHQLPSLPHKILTKTPMWRLIHQTKPRPLINPMRPNQYALRPKNHLLIPSRPRKTNALLHQSIPQPHTPSTRFNKQQPQLRSLRLLRMLHQKNMPHVLRHRSPQSSTAPSSDRSS